MHRAFHVVLLLALVAIALPLAQEGTPNSAADGGAADRIASISQRLSFKDDDPADKARYYAESEILTGQLRGEVDMFIQSYVNMSEGSGQVQMRLRAVLASHKPNPEYGDMPFAKALNLRFGRSLVIVYTLVRPPHNDIATIRGYRLDGNRFSLVDTTGADFEGYNMFRAELTAPLKDEFWMLAWGQAHGFNGKKVRFRVYSFDGQRFTTVWSPEDVLDATAHITNTGFVVDHDVRSPPYEIHDEYSVTLNGIIKIN